MCSSSFEAKRASGRRNSNSVDQRSRFGQNSAMDQLAIITCLKRNKPGLQAQGLKHISLFGSAARGSAGENSDIDLAVELDEKAGIDLFGFAALTERLAELLGSKVDMIAEPARNSRMQAEIDRDRVRVY